jgi:muramoyltetrapeptide carboxypeptidase
MRSIGKCVADCRASEDAAPVIGSALPQLLRPRALAPGDLVVIASLSGPLHARYAPDLDRAVAEIERMGFRVRLAPLLEPGRQHWWSAARPAEIAEELNALLRDRGARDHRA